MMDVLVETNWVVDWASPVFLGNATQARALLDRARAGELRLHVPSVSLAEARKVIRNKVQPKREFKAVSDYANRLTELGELSADDRDVVRRVTQLYTNELRRSLEGLEARLNVLREEPGLEVFSLTEPMLERANRLATEPNLLLEPFDNAILAAFLVRAEELRASSPSEIYLAELDGDLYPYDNVGKPKQPLHNLYTSAGFTNFYRNFSLTERDTESHV